MAHLSPKEITSLSGDGEAPPPTAHHRRRGGWATTPFIIASLFGLTLASAGWASNLIVFLIKNYNIKSIDAAQIQNVVNGCVSFSPLLAAVAADSLLSCFSLIWISSLISLLGLILLTLTVTVDALRPPVCVDLSSNSCPTPSPSQHAVLYSALALVAIGIGGTRFTLATMGANQLTAANHHSSFFNWYFFSFYSAGFIGSTCMVYVEDNFGWRLGFGICIAANVLGLVLFLIGTPYYIYRRENHPQGRSPFTGMLRVVVAAVRKREAEISSQTDDYYYGDGGGVKGLATGAPTTRFRCLNRAALKADGDVLPDGSVSSPWRLCTVQQVEDLKSVIRVLPLWSSSIFLATPIGVQLSLTVLQSLASDRRLTASFTFPAGSIIVFSLISTALGVILIDRCLRQTWRKITPLQQIGTGHVFNVASMAVSSLVESRRRRGSSAGHPMSVAWLVPQMVVVGIGEAFHFPGQVGLYYKEFPACLKGVATAMVAVAIGVSFYLGTAVVDFIRRVTDWLPNDIDDGRVDCVYWVMVVIGVVNFGYFLVISWFYKYKNGEEDVVTKDQIVCGDQA